jgi:site-specific recombinase XerC
VQLWFGEQLAARLKTNVGTLGYQAPDSNPGRTLARGLAAPPAVSVSAHLLNRDQFVLFEADRDWSRVIDRPLPALTPAARALVDELDRRGRRHSWPYVPRRESARTLLLAVAWLGAEAPLHEADIRAVATHLSHARAWRVIQFLRSHGLLIPVPTVDADLRMVEQIIDSLPTQISVEVPRWVQVLRGRGRRPHPPMAWGTIRSYLYAVQPVLQHWSARDWSARGSLRAISHADVDAVIRERRGRQAAKMASALRSLFRALKQERPIFINPTRGMSVTNVISLPSPLPSDRLAGLLDSTTNPALRLVIALIAVHALTRHDIRHLLVEDVDLAHGRLTVRCVGGNDVVYLDATTYQLARQWLAERHRRWPRSTNPHLLVSSRTAPDNRHPPISPLTISVPLRRLGHSARQLRADRILHEARHSADPVALIRIFGVSVTTAMRYLTAAHPERRSALP